MTSETTKILNIIPVSSSAPATYLVALWWTWHWRRSTRNGWLSRFSAIKLTIPTLTPIYFFSDNSRKNRMNFLSAIYLLHITTFFGALINWLNVFMFLQRQRQVSFRIDILIFMFLLLPMKWLPKIFVVITWIGEIVHLVVVIIFVTNASSTVPLLSENIAHIYLCIFFL